LALSRVLATPKPRAHTMRWSSTMAIDRRECPSGQFALDERLQGGDDAAVAVGGVIVGASRRLGAGRGGGQHAGAPARRGSREAFVIKITGRSPGMHSAPGGQ